MRFALRALVWLAASAGLLLAGFAAFGAAAVAASVLQRAQPELPGPVQREALGLLYSAIATRALLPELALAFASWLLVARLAPAVERSGRALAIALPVVAAACFPAVGALVFNRIWSPAGPGTYLVTLFLVAGGAALALLVPRALSVHLAPGSFAATPKGDMVHPHE